MESFSENTSSEDENHIIHSDVEEEITLLQSSFEDANENSTKCKWGKANHVNECKIGAAAAEMSKNCINEIQLIKRELDEFIPHTKDQHAAHGTMLETHLGENSPACKLLMEKEALTTKEAYWKFLGTMLTLCRKSLSSSAVLSSNIQNQTLDEMTKTCLINHKECLETWKLTSSCGLPKIGMEMRDGTVGRCC